MRSPEDSTIRNAPVPGKRVDTVTMMGGNTHEDSILGSDAKRSSDRTGNRGLCGSRLGRSATCDLLASSGLGLSAKRGGAATPGRAAGLLAELRQRFPQGLVAIALEQSRGAVIAALMHFD